MLVESFNLTGGTTRGSKKRARNRDLKFARPLSLSLLFLPDSGDLGGCRRPPCTPLTQAHLLVPSLAGGRGQVAAGEPQLLSLSLWRFGEEGSGEGLVLGLLIW